MERVDCVVIGAGVVGLAVARALAMAGREVLVIERHGGIGEETSSRNSEVIHAGLYYPTGSLKARLCVEGRRRLYDYCADHGVAHRRCGKLVVATDEAQRGALDALLRQARDNGCTEVVRLDAAQARALEPDLACVAALHSPETGIVDSHGLMLAYQGDAERAGAMLALRSTVCSGEVSAGGIVVRVLTQEGGDHAEMVQTELLARLVVNCSGLWAPSVAASITGLDPAVIPRAWFAKGNYYSLASRPPFSRLIYPLPQPGGLGVHLTLDLAGMGRFGPDVEWLGEAGADVSDPPDYAVDPSRSAGFYSEIRRYWPALPDDALQPAYAGVRPKISGPGMAAADFRIDLPATHGTAGYVGLYGIESPGLTASLAIGAYVAGRLPELISATVS